MGGLICSIDGFLQRECNQKAYKFPDFLNLSALSEDKKKLFFEQLKNNPNLTCLDFEGCMIGGSDFLLELGKVLSVHPEFDYLTLSNNKLTDSDIEKLCTHNPVIRGLTLDRNECTNVSLDYLTQIENLQSLSILDNDQLTTKGKNTFLKNKPIRLTCRIPEINTFSFVTSIITTLFSAARQSTPAAPPENFPEVYGSPTKSARKINH